MLSVLRDTHAFCCLSTAATELCLSLLSQIKQKLRKSDVPQSDPGSYLSSEHLSLLMFKDFIQILTPEGFTVREKP